RAQSSKSLERTVRLRLQNVRPYPPLKDISRQLCWPQRSPSSYSPLPSPPPLPQRRGPFDDPSFPPRVPPRSIHPRPMDAADESPPAHCPDATLPQRSAC